MTRTVSIAVLCLLLLFVAGCSDGSRATVPSSFTPVTASRSRTATPTVTVQIGTASYTPAVALPTPSPTCRVIFDYGNTGIYPTLEPSRLIPFKITANTTNPSYEGAVAWSNRLGGFGVGEALYIHNTGATPIPVDGSHFITNRGRTFASRNFASGIIGSGSTRTVEIYVNQGETLTWYVGGSTETVTVPYVAPASGYVLPPKPPGIC